MDSAIRTEHLTKIYAGRVIAVNDMSLEVPRGAVYGLLGPNGAGKTTTLRLLLGLQRATAGRAEVFGQTCGANATGVRRLIGYLPTHPALPGHLRPVEYLELLGKLCRIPRQTRKPRLTSLLRAVGLLGATDQRIQTFSTGMRTRLGIAASLLADPPILLWDEPTAGLDPAARRFTLDLIRDLAKQRTVVVATHILSDIDQICDHVGVMHEGRMIFSGSMRDMKQRLRRDDFSFELDGAVDEVQRVAEQADRLDGLAAIVREGHTMVVEVSDGRSRAGAVAEVLRLVEASDASLQTIRSGQNETEYAYLQLLKEDSAMDSGGSISKIGAATMPTLAILLYELRSLATSWLVRVWLIGTLVLTFLTVASSWGNLPSPLLIAALLFPFLVFPWFLVVMLLGISPVTGTRLEALADGILSRPVTRYEYLLAAWAARVAVVLTVYFLVVLPAVWIVAVAKRPVPVDSVTFYGIIAALSVVALVLTFLVSLGFFVGTLLRGSLLSAVVLIFVWIPINLVLHTFSLEEFSPISLNQALPTLLRTPWRHTEASSETSVNEEDLRAAAEQIDGFIRALSGGPPPPKRPPPNFYDRGDYEDFSLLRVILGYAIPTLAAVGLATLCFCWRDL